MGTHSPDGLLAHAAELERRDEAVARELALVTELGERAGVLRARAAEIRDGLERIPGELDELAERRSRAERDAAEARVQREEAEARVERLESGRRRRDDELERARREVETSRDTVYDAERQVERLDVAAAELRDEQEALAREAAGIVDGAGDVAAEIGRLERVAEAGRGEPGTTLDALEEWGGRVRSALFVARGALESERERIVVEANALGSAVLGEQLGASSVALVRRRIEDALR